MVTRLYSGWYQRLLPHLTPEKVARCAHFLPAIIDQKLTARILEF